jgi:hypothetical protein
VFGHTCSVIIIATTITQKYKSPQSTQTVTPCVLCFALLCSPNHGATLTTTCRHKNKTIQEERKEKTPRTQQIPLNTLLASSSTYSLAGELPTAATRSTTWHIASRSNYPTTTQLIAQVAAWVSERWWRRSVDDRPESSAKIVQV